MKILFYNWVDYLDDENRGGGVSVYQKNLIHALEEQEDVQCTFLSSGISYDLFSDVPRWERVRHGPPADRKHRFEIVNSGTLSPAHHSFGDPRQVDEPVTADTFFDFMRENGPFDVVHFNNLEGLPGSVLALKEHFPDTRVVLALHNYYPVCPQVNLWFQERENCLDYDEGRKCVTCLPFRHDDRVVRLANAVAFNLKKRGIRPGTRLFDRGFGPAMRVANRLVRVYRRRFNRKPPATAPRQRQAPGELLTTMRARNRDFVQRRTDMATLINTHCDTVLCVSDQVGRVAARFGIAPDLLTTSYIGTRHAEKFAETAPKATILKPDGTVTMAYLGYMRRDKGFFFLLDTLETMPVENARRVHLIICSRLSDQHTMDRIGTLSERFASVRFAPGYSHDQLDQLLADVDLGVIPVLWEDNLPQVAIEMHARHIPLLTSDLGGAQELGNYPGLVFEGGKAKSFHDRIDAILDGKTDTDAYWKGAMPPYSMAGHVDELMKVYDAPPRDMDLRPSARDSDPVIGHPVPPQITKQRGKADKIDKAAARTA